MGARPILSLRDLRKILASFGVQEDRSRGKGGHTLFYKQFPEGVFSYPLPTSREVDPNYIRPLRRKFRLLPSDGISDDEFYGRA